MQPHSTDYPFLTGGGECAALIARLDWSATPLGAIGAWPDVLRSTLSLVLASPIPIVVLWGEEGVMLYNDAYSEIAGGRHPSALGGKVREVWPELADFNDHVMTVVLAGETLRFQDQKLTVHRNGVPEEMWINLDYSPIRDAMGKPVAVMAVVLETTAKVKAHRLLEDDRERLQRMFEQAPGFIAMVSGPEHRFELANPAYVSLVGKRDLIGMPVREALPELEGQVFFDLLDRAYFQGEPTVRVAERILLRREHGRDAETRFIDFSYQPVRDAANAVMGVFVQGTDVTQHVESQQAMQQSEDKFRAFTQALPSQVWSADSAGRLDWFNERMTEYVGMPAGSLDSTYWTGFAHPDDLPRFEAAWANAVSTGEALEHEVRLKGADGSYRWHLARALPMHDAGHRITRWIGANANIHDQKLAERLLERVNRDLEQQVADSAAERDRMWRLSSDLMLVADFNASIVSINPAWIEVLGWQPVDLIGRSFMSLVHPDDAAATLAEVSSLSEGTRTYHFVNRYRHHDGSWRTLSWTAVPDKDFIHAVGRDMTASVLAAEALQRTERALQQSQKMETLGQLTGGVAHDFNNLLQVISGNLHMLSRDVRGNAPAERRLTHALSGVERGARLASQLLAFGRRQPLEPKAVRLSRLLYDMDDMLRRSLGDAIEIETIAGGGLWNTLVDPAQVENAILNLAINARDAMGGAGKLTVEVGNAYLDEHYAAENTDVAPGQYVMLAVSDTGCGMTPDVLARAFEPFFSTKPEGKGSGLGLSMVYGFTKQSGGHVKLYSDSGSGTTVRLYLPRTREHEVRSEPREIEMSRGGTETILVAEDDEQVRATVVDMLGDLGYRVLKAGDAASALAIVESGVPIDLVFTDVVMPGPLRSTDLAERVRQRSPSTRVLFTSGYTENSIVHGGRLDAGVELLSKPYSRDALALRIRKMLDQPLAPPCEGAVVSPVDTARDEVSSASSGASRESPTLLYVEDEPLVREGTAEMLDAMGYVVHQADNAKDALAILASRPIDVLITDIGLPDLPGDQLARLARVDFPRLGIIFATGRDTTPLLPHSVMLRKPYDSFAIEAAIRKIVDEARAPLHARPGKPAV